MPGALIAADPATVERRGFLHGGICRPGHWETGKAEGNPTTREPGDLPIREGDHARDWGILPVALHGGCLGRTTEPMRMPRLAGREGRAGMTLPATTFVLGGARSGKSAFAEGLVLKSGLSPVYVATGRAADGEMKERIARHRERRGDGWRTVEEPLDLTGVLQRNAGSASAVLVDCLTLWLTNLMMEGRDVEAETARLAGVLPSLPGLVVLVSNEVGLGIVPDNAMARAFRDHAGRLHQQIAAMADEVYFMAAGLPLKMKG